MTVAVVDANVLYSIEVTDLLLTLATRHQFRLHWSPEILDEVKRNLMKRVDLPSAAISYRIEMMNRALPAALNEAPAGLIDTMPIKHHDRHVLALAVHTGADAIITHNLRDFPSSACKQLGVEAISPDDFLVREAQYNPTAVVGALADIAKRRRRPPKTIPEILDRLETTLPALVDFVRRKTQ